MGTKKGVKKSLASSRPPTAKTTQKAKTLSRRATKALINKHHLLEKKKQQAIIQGDEAAEAAIDAEIVTSGGILAYQEASLQGQRSERGGDSSRVLVNWLGSASSTLKARPLRMLEVGALSTDNACSKCGYFDVERIDLNSQEKEILQQDFMERPLPKSDDERFDIISLSLVLNYVPDPTSRGDMLLRTLDFLRGPDTAFDSSLSPYFPSLFLVLPLPCVSSSRYLNETKLKAMMDSLGYSLVESKLSRRLAYYLWKRQRKMPDLIPHWAKREINPGHQRNNFAIVINDHNTTLPKSSFRALRV